MRWIGGHVLRPILWLIAGGALAVYALGRSVGYVIACTGSALAQAGDGSKRLGRACRYAGNSRLSRALRRALTKLGKGLKSRSRRVSSFGAQVLVINAPIAKFSFEVLNFRREARRLALDLKKSIKDEQESNPLDGEKSTIFLLVTTGQAVRNFLLSDVFRLLRSRYNVVILSPFAHTASFRTKYSKKGVHVLPWFNRFRTVFERYFEYYFMINSYSRTHHSWLTNLEFRAKKSRRRSSRFQRLMFMRKVSDVLGNLVGARALLGLYGSYFLSHIPPSLLRGLFEAYDPKLVISTVSYHTEAFPLTYYARRWGCKTVTNVLSWDNTTTKPIMDNSSEYYTVWSHEMQREIRCQFPHMRPKILVVGCPMFDLYFNKPFALDRSSFLAMVGLPSDKPYILYTTNTIQAMPDECEVVRQFWDAVNGSSLAGKVSLLVRLHPKDSIDRYESLMQRDDVVVTLAGQPHWGKSDHWLPDEDDMGLLLNSMLHAAVSLNVASTMSLESFAVGLPTINVAFKSEPNRKDRGTKWSFDMYHFSEHYHALVENGSVEIAWNVQELLDMTMRALNDRSLRKEAMLRTLEQKAAYCDGTSARRYVEVIDAVIQDQQPASVTLKSRDSGLVQGPHGRRRRAVNGNGPEAAVHLAS